jgi:hypothetical protein
MTQRAVATSLDWSVSKVIRIEQGTVGLQPSDARVMLELYGVRDPDRVKQLMEWARAAKYDPYRGYRELFSGSFLAYLDYELAASRIRQFHPSIIPGLLQTEGYARSLLEEGLQIDADRAERIIEARLQRQESLVKEEAGKLSFILDEACLRRVVGGVRAHKLQLEHLRELVLRGSVNIKIVPFSAGAHAGIKGPFVLLEFDDGASDLVYLENADGDRVHRDDSQTVVEYSLRYEHLQSLAVDFADFLDESSGYP